MKYTLETYKITTGENTFYIHRYCRIYMISLHTPGMHYPPLSYKERCVNINIFLLAFRREMKDIRVFLKSMLTTNFSKYISVKTFCQNLYTESKTSLSPKRSTLESQLLKTETRNIILIELLLYGTNYHQNCVWIILLIFLLMRYTISILTSSKTHFTCNDIC